MNLSPSMNAEATKYTVALRLAELAQGFARLSVFSRDDALQLALLCRAVINVITRMEGFLMEVGK